MELRGDKPTLGGKCRACCRSARHEPHLNFRLYIKSLYRYDLAKACLGMPHGVSPTDQVQASSAFQPVETPESLQVILSKPKAKRKYRWDDPIIRRNQQAIEDVFVQVLLQPSSASAEGSLIPVAGDEMSEFSESDSELSSPPPTTKRAKGKQSTKPAQKSGGKANSRVARKSTTKKATPKRSSAAATSQDQELVQTDTQNLDEVVDASDEESGTQPRGTKRKRKTQAEKEAEAMPLAARTPGLKMFVGAHTSIAKGVENAITNAVHIGGNSFACFLKSQRKWDNPSLQDANRDAFKAHLITHKFDAASHIVPHGSYLVNLATEDPELQKKSYAAFLDDLKRCEALGIRYYNFHPGAAGKATLESAIGRLAANLNRALSATTSVVPLLENMASRGSVLGGRFSDLAGVIDLIEPRHKHRIGVCIDTCHSLASGYDLRSPVAFAATMTEFDETVGMQYLKALHLNDSKAPLGSGRDLHQNIGLGFLGLRAFHNVMNEPRFENLPLVLETPCDRPDPKDPSGKKTIDDKNVWAREIKLLESLIGMDAESAEFKALEKRLSDEGRADRAKHQKAYDDKLAKDKKKVEKEREKGQKSVKDMFGGGGKSKGKKKLPVRSANGDGESSSELSEHDSGEDER